MKVQWCWRCKMDIPMLDEEEWAQVMASRTSDAGKHNMLQAILSEYNRLTAFGETNPSAVWHHRISIYGPPCPRCGKVLRTPVAYKCFECGHVARPPGHE